MPQTIDYHNTTFLVVDDQRPFLLMMKSILINLGARTIDLVASGENAIKSVKSRDYDFVLIDYNLGGKRKNGRQLIEELRVKRYLKPECVCIMVTGENQKPMVLGAVEMQPDDYLMKPFSQNLLKLRIERTYAKRLQFKSVYRAMMESKHDLAIAECKKIIQQKTKYTSFCNNILAELLCNAKMYDQAEYILTKLLANKPYTWGQLQLSRTYYHQEKYQQALELANEVMKQAPLIMDAYDLAAKSLLALGHHNNALEIALKATELSPYSMTRQHQLCQIAREAEMHDLVKDACYHILELSHKSVHQSPIHLYNYVRAIVTAAEQCEDKSEKRKYEQEILIALQQNKQEEMHNNKLGFETFEIICQINIDILNNRMFKAKKQLYQLQHKFLQSESAHIPSEFLTDMVINLYKIGEFDEADEMVEKNDLDDVENNFEIEDLHYLQKQIREKRKTFSDHNKTGIEAYKNQDYLQAITEFEFALQQAPMNTGCTLNLILAILKLLEANKKAPEELKTKIKHAFMNLEGVRLPESQQDRYDNLYDQYERRFLKRK